MDHLLSHGKPRRIPFHVPLLATDDPSDVFPRDGLEGSWSRYPEKKGWDKDSLADFDRFDILQNGQKTPAEAAAFLQTWLYFGLITIVLNRPIRLEQFSYTAEDGQLYVTSKMLPIWFMEWAQKVRAASEGERHTLSLALDRFFRYVEPYYCWCLKKDKRKPRLRTPLPDIVVLSILVLHKTLLTVKKMIFGGSTFEPTWTFFQDISSINPILSGTLRDIGWSDDEISTLPSTASFIFRYHLVSIGPKRFVHNRNRATTRSLSKNAQAPYRHATEGCTCEAVGLTLDQLQETINAGQVPLLSIDNSGDDSESTVKLAFGTSNTRYVAMSHVCSEGLGNPLANTLPMCQLKAIQATVNTLCAEVPDATSEHRNGTDNIPFWIDTCCVPLKLFNSDLRDKTLAKMASIYKDAYRVLVWDPELRETPIKDDITLALARIVTSTWWTRLWTLQEGLLPRNIHFCMSDGFLSGSQLYGMAKYANNHIPDGGEVMIQLMYTHILQIISLFWRFKRASVDQRGTYLWKAIDTRSTSKAEDEAICLAALLEVDLQRIVDQRPDRRMEELYLSRDVWPAQLIFQKDYGNIETPGLRWAPKSLVVRSRGRVSSLTVSDFSAVENPNILPPSGRRQDRGLVVNYPGFRLWVEQDPHLVFNTLLFYETTTNFWYQVGGITWPDLDQSRWLKLGIILPRVLHNEGMGDSVIRGLLVEMEDFDKMDGTVSSPGSSQKDVLYCHSLENVTVAGKTQDPYSLWKIDDPLQVDNAARAVIYTSDQSWCVD